MENKNNVIVVLLVVLIGIFAGVGLLIGIGNAVGVALSPLNAKISEIAIRQRYIEDKLASLNNNNSGNLDKRLADMQNQLTQMDQKIGTAGRSMPAAASSSLRPKIIIKFIPLIPGNSVDYRQ